MLTYFPDLTKSENVVIFAKAPKKRVWRPASQTYLPILKQYPIVKVWLIPVAQNRQAVYHIGGWSGLSLGPKSDEARPIKDEAQTICEEWYIHYDCAQKVLAGPFDFINEAQYLAALLAHFDWTRLANKFSRREIWEVRRIIAEYMREIEWFYRIEAEVLQEFFSDKKNGGSELLSQRAA